MDSNVEESMQNYEMDISQNSNKSSVSSDDIQVITKINKNSKNNGKLDSIEDDKLVSKSDGKLDILENDNVVSYDSCCENKLISFINSKEILGAADGSEVMIRDSGTQSESNDLISSYSLNQNIPIDVYWYSSSSLLWNICIDGTNGSSINCAGTGWVNSVFNISFTTEGIHSVQLLGTDTAGNTYNSNILKYAIGNAPVSGVEGYIYIRDHTTQQQSGNIEKNVGDTCTFDIYYSSNGAGLTYNVRVNGVDMTTFDAAYSWDVIFSGNNNWGDSRTFAVTENGTYTVQLYYSGDTTYVSNVLTYVVGSSSSGGNDSVGNLSGNGSSGNASVDNSSGNGSSGNASVDNSSGNGSDDNSHEINSDYVLSVSKSTVDFWEQFNIYFTPSDIYNLNSGSVAFYLNGYLIYNYTYSSAGRLSVYHVGAPAGILNISAYYSGDGGNHPAGWTNNVIVNVNPVTTSITASDVILNQGESGTLSVSLIDADGDVVSNETISATINGILYQSRTNENGIAIINIPSNLAVGNYTVSLNYEGGLWKKHQNPDSLLYWIGNYTYGNDADGCHDSSTGSATIRVIGEEGNYDSQLNLILNPSTIDLGVSTLITANVISNNTNVQNGVVEIFVNGISFKNITAGQSVYYTPNNVGNYSITGKYYGYDKYNSASTIVDMILTVNKEDIPVINDKNSTNTIINLSSSSVNSGELISISSSILSNGNFLVNKVVEIFVDGLSYGNISSGSSISYNSSVIGNHVIFARFAGDSDYESSMSSFICLTIVDVPSITPIIEETITNISLSSSSIDLGENLTVTPSVSSNGSFLFFGEVEVFVDGVSIDNITAGSSINYVFDELGNHIIFAKYKGFANYGESLSDFVKINIKETEVDFIDTKVSINVSNIKEGDVEIISIDLTDINNNPINGMVIVNLNGTYYFSNVTDGKSVIMIKNLVIGTYTVSASVIANNIYLSSNSEVKTFNVSFTTKSADVNIDVSVEDIKEGEDAIINIKLTDNEDSPLEGNVIVTVDKTDYVVNISGGKGNITIKNLNRGNYSVEVNFLGDDNNEASSGSATLNVLEYKDVFIDISSGVKNISVELNDGEGIPLNATVNVTVGGKTTEITLVDGKASLGADIGEQEVIVTYAGDDTHAPSTKIKVLIVSDVVVINNTEVINNTIVNNITKELIETVINVIVENSGLGNDTNIKFNLTDIEGNPLTTIISVKINDDMKNVTISNGTGSITLYKITAGNYTVVASYAGNDVYQKSSTSNTFNIARKATIFHYSDMVTTALNVTHDGRIGEYFYVNLTDIDGNPLVNKSVQIGFNGVVYNRITNATGGFKLQINLKHVFVYTFAISFVGDDDYSAAFNIAKITTKAQTPNLIVNNKTYKASANTKTLSATYLSNAGNPISGKVLTFKINGKSYTAITNSKGVATVKVSLTKKATYSFLVSAKSATTYAAVSKYAALKVI